MMHYLDSLLARTTGAPDRGRFVMPRPVSLFEPVSVPVSGPALAATAGSDAGVADTGTYEQPDSSVPGAPITGSAVDEGANANDQPDRLKPRLQATARSESTGAHPSAGDVSSRTVSRPPAQDASAGSSPSRAAGRAAASSVQGPPITRSASDRSVDAHDEADRLQPPLQPRPDAAPGLAAGRGGAANINGVEASAGERARTPRATDAYTQPDRLKPRLQPRPDAAPGLAAGRAGTADINGVEASAGLTMDAYSETDRLKPRLQADHDAGPETAGGRTGYPHPPVTPAVRQAALPGPGMGESATPSPPAARPEAAQTPAAAPPVVRVTIGRVEVRAVLPPPVVEAPRTRSASGPSLSLDDYLKQGRGGA